MDCAVKAFVGMRWMMAGTVLMTYLAGVVAGAPAVPKRVIYSTGDPTNEKFGPTDDPVELEYRALVAMTRGPAIEVNDAKQREARAAMRNELHRLGLAFLEKHPSSPRRWDVVNLLRAAPTFAMRVETDGRVEMVPDRERAKAWRLRHIELLQQLLEASDARPAAREVAYASLIDEHSMNFNVHANAAGEEPTLVRIMDWLSSFHREFPHSSRLERCYHEVSEVLDRVDPKRNTAFLAQVKSRHATGSFHDVRIRAMVDGRLRLMQAQAEPIWLRLRTIDGRFADTSSYRGKVVLLAMFPATWEVYENLLQTLYGMHHGGGLEIVHVSTGENVDTRQRLRPEEVARRAAEKRWPWPVVFDGDDLIGEFARSMGQNASPAWILIGRDGRVSAEIPSGAQLDAAIRAELELGPEAPAASR